MKHITIKQSFIEQAARDGWDTICALRDEHGQLTGEYKLLHDEDDFPAGTTADDFIFTQDNMHRGHRYMIAVTSIFRVDENG